MHIIGQSRIDTWQTPSQLVRRSQNRLVHRPIQVQGKSRIDTWQTNQLRRSTRDIVQVCILVFSWQSSLSISRTINLFILSDRVAWIPGKPFRNLRKAVNMNWYIVLFKCKARAASIRGKPRNESLRAMRTEWYTGQFRLKGKVASIHGKHPDLAEEFVVRAR